LLETCLFFMQWVASHIPQVCWNGQIPVLLHKQWSSSGFL
jgi:hypothetical protein